MEIYGKFGEMEGGFRITSEEVKNLGEKILNVLDQFHWPFQEKKVAKEWLDGTEMYLQINIIRAIGMIHAPAFEKNFDDPKKSIYFSMLADLYTLQSNMLFIFLELKDVSKKINNKDRLDILKQKLAELIKFTILNELTQSNKVGEFRKKLCDLSSTIRRFD